MRPTPETLVAVFLMEQVERGIERSLAHWFEQNLAAASARPPTNKTPITVRAGASINQRRAVKFKSIRAINSPELAFQRCASPIANNSELWLRRKLNFVGQGRIAVGTPERSLVQRANRQSVVYRISDGEQPCAKSPSVSLAMRRPGN
jgi:hypothetical protein